MRVRLETEAKLQIQALAKQKLVALIWSYVLDYENSRNPIPSRMESIQLWRDLASHRLLGSRDILNLAEQIKAEFGVKSFDGLHLACAMTAKADMFVTTDDQILRKLKSAKNIQVIPPVEALSILERWYESRN